MQFEKSKVKYKKMKYRALKFQNGHKALKLNGIICKSRLLRLPEKIVVLHRVKMQKTASYVEC